MQSTHSDHAIEIASASGLPVASGLAFYVCPKILYGRGREHTANKEPVGQQDVDCAATHECHVCFSTLEARRTTISELVCLGLQLPLDRLKRSFAFSNPVSSPKPSRAGWPESGHPPVQCTPERICLVRPLGRLRRIPRCSAAIAKGA